MFINIFSLSGAHDALVCHFAEDKDIRFDAYGSGSSIFSFFVVSFFFFFSFYSNMVV